MFDIVALGESLIDFTPSGVNDVGINLFACNPGGAPANVLAMNTKLGGCTAFIGKVGNDEFGLFLQRTMEDAGIDCRGLRYSKDIPTTLAFVQLNEHGDRSFSFYRKPGADIMLTWEEVDKALLGDCKIFHFGSVSLTDEPCCTATLKAAEYAKSHGAIISYDPNFRQLLWADRKKAIEKMKAPLRYTDILKVSDEEMTLLTGETSLEAGAAALASYGISVVLVTLGPKGAFYYTPNASGLSKAYPVKTIDTTGAGDSFLGAMLYCLSGKSVVEINQIPDYEWIDILKFCNAAGSLATTYKGAIPAMPDLDQIMACITRFE